MFSFLRASLPERTNSANNNPIIYEDGRSKTLFRQSDANYVIQQTLRPKDGDDSLIEPPLHFHLYQDEHLAMTKGSMDVYLGTQRTPAKTLSATSEGQRKAVVPKLTYHRFENRSETEEAIVEVYLSPQDYAQEERFFRNCFGYLDDCKKAGRSPNPFQLFVFFHAADMPLAIPIPITSVGVLLSRIAMTVMAYIGMYILGFQSSYPEYYNGKKSS